MIGQRSKRERFAIPNRLVHEDSPSLRQHAGDPVDWWPWCDKAFKKALAENRPLFLSVGHSGCHWCHVMEREVFENETIAAYLNDLFVGIKVDREERPDLYGLTARHETLAMATHTLESMARGGLYDHVDGGFCRYSTDDSWLVPHFEKMAYDNALLIQSYLYAHRLTGTPLFLRIAEETIGFMKEKMGEGGLFYADSDADTDGKEGRYYLYDHSETVEALVEDGFLQRRGQSPSAPARRGSKGPAGHTLSICSTKEKAAHHTRSAVIAPASHTGAIHQKSKRKSIKKTDRKQLSKQIFQKDDTYSNIL